MAGAYGSVDAGISTESPSKIRDRISGAEEVLSMIYQTFDALEKRLETVLTPAPPDAPTTSSAQPRQPSSPMLERLDSINGGLHNMEGRIRRLTARVEV